VEKTMLFTLFGKEVHFSMISSVMLFTLAQMSFQQSGTIAGIYPLSE
jgi:hypothetical protein